MATLATEITQEWLPGIPVGNVGYLSFCIKTRHAMARNEPEWSFTYYCVTWATCSKNPEDWSVECLICDVRFFLHNLINIGVIILSHLFIRRILFQNKCITQTKFVSHFFVFLWACSLGLRFRKNKIFGDLFNRQDLLNCLTNTFLIIVGNIVKFSNLGYYDWDSLLNHWMFHL